MLTRAMKYVGGPNVWKSDGLFDPLLEAVKSFSGSTPRYLVHFATLRADSVTDAVRAFNVRDASDGGRLYVREISRSLTKPPGSKKPSSVADGSLRVATTIACSWNEAFGFINPLQFWRLTQRIRSVWL